MYRCKKGCVGPSGKAKWHGSARECPFERPGAAPAVADLPGHSTSESEPVPAEPPPKKPFGFKIRSDGITFPERAAEVVKTGGSTPMGETPPAEVDYIVDGPHTRSACDLAYKGLQLVTVAVDDFLEYPSHIPEKFFHLTPFEITAIEADPRNFFSRTVTWGCKNVLRCKTLEDAHRSIDTAVFLSAFGGIGYVIFSHYRVVYKESPRLKRGRAKKAARKAQIAEARARQRGAEPTLPDELQEVPA